MDVEMQWECEIDNNPVFDNRLPNMYRYYCWKKAKDRQATTINPKLLLKMVEEEVFFWHAGSRYRSASPADGPL